MNDLYQKGYSHGLSDRDSYNREFVIRSYRRKVSDSDYDRGYRQAVEEVYPELLSE